MDIPTSDIQTDGNSPAAVPAADILAQVRGKPVQRFFTIDRAAINADKRTVEIAFSSETAVERWFGWETLDHGAKSVRMDFLKGGRAPFLTDHKVHDGNSQIGVVTKAWIDGDRTGRAVVRFGKSARASEYLQDVIDGIRSNVSVGYLIHSVVLEREENGQKWYRVTDWEPIEVSLVTVPADTEVGVGRMRIPEPPNHHPNPPPETPAQPRSHTMNETQTSPAATPDPKPAVTTDESRVREAERLRIEQITQLASRFPQLPPDALKAAIREGLTTEAFAARILDQIGRPVPVNQSAADLDLTKKERERFSILKVVRAVEAGGVFGADAGFEREACEAVRQKLMKQGRQFRAEESVIVPNDVLARPGEGLYRRMLDLAMKRALTAGEGNEGGYTVATDVPANAFIELLRNKALMLRLGVRVLPGLQGNVDIPKQSAAAAAYWMDGEDDEISDAGPEFDRVQLAPKTVGGHVHITRQLLLQSSIDVEAFVMEDLVQVVARAIDAAILNGSGSDGQPQGILGAGIGSVSGTSLNRPGIIELESDVDTANALPEDAQGRSSVAAVCKPAVRGLLKGRAATGMTSGIYLVTDDNTANGYPVHTTEQMPAATLLFGDFSQAILGEWGGLELIRDPYSLAQNALLRILAFASADVGVRHVGAFSAAGTIT